VNATDEPIPYTHEFVVDADYQRSLARALYLSQFRSAAAWILLGAMLVFLGVSILGRIGPFVVVWLLLIAAVWGLRYFRVRGVVRATFPIGKVMRSGFGATHFALSDGENSSLVAYSGIASIDAAAAVVWMRRTTPPRRAAYPRALFADTDVERIRAAIAARTAEPRLSSADSPRPTPNTPA
jgi:hypothetical protein